MVKWHGYSASQNTWEPKVYLPTELIETFELPDSDLVRVEKAREKISLLFEGGLKVPLQYEDTIEIRHDGVRFLLPNLVAPVEISHVDLQDGGLAPFVEWTINVNAN